MIPKRTRLLVVDDIEEIREHMKAYFERRDYSVFSAGSAQEALSIIKEQNPDIMLLDMNLPKINGLELLRLVRQFNNTIKVIMVTGYDVDYHKEPQFKDLNILDCVHKPIMLPDLEKVVNKALS